MYIPPSRLKIDENPQLLTVEEAAALAHVSPSTIRNWVNESLPAFRYGRIIRIDRNSLLAFISQFVVNNNQENG